MKDDPSGFFFFKTLPTWKGSTELHTYSCINILISVWVNILSRYLFYIYFDYYIADCKMKYTVLSAMVLCGDNESWRIIIILCLLGKKTNIILFLFQIFFSGKANSNIILCVPYIVVLMLIRSLSVVWKQYNNGRGKHCSPQICLEQ
jgi:hypothetical protein